MPGFEGLFASPSEAWVEVKELLQKLPLLRTFDHLELAIDVLFIEHLKSEVGEKNLVSSQNLEQNAAQGKYICLFEDFDVFSVCLEVDDSGVLGFGEDFRRKVAVLVDLRVEESEQIEVLVQVKMRTNDTEVG